MSLVKALQVCDPFWNRVTLGSFHDHYTIVAKQIEAGAFFENLRSMIMTVGWVGKYQVEGPAHGNNRQCGPDILHDGRGPVSKLAAFQVFLDEAHRLAGIVNKPGVVGTTAYCFNSQSPAAGIKVEDGTVCKGTAATVQDTEQGLSHPVRSWSNPLSGKSGQLTATGTTSDHTHQRLPLCLLW